MKNQPFHKRLRFALNGLCTTWKTERSFRTQTVLAFAAILLLVFFKPEPIWWALFFIAIGAVLTAELLNTSLEYYLDEFHKEEHPVIKQVKDVAAAAVLVASLMSLGVATAFLFHVLG